jgi:glutathione-specific gamma-glutamylcyclotransferase
MTGQTKPVSQKRLSRETLSRDDYHEYISTALPGVRLLSQPEMDNSARATLGQRPVTGTGAWVFAYGSLLWDCPLLVSAQKIVTVSGWHRAFCLENTIGRGTPEHPGLTMALDEGGECTGLAYHVEEQNLASEIKILWRREMPLGTYSPRWIEARDAEGMPVGPTLAFAADPGNPRYLGKLRFEDVVARLRTASGTLGTSADYLLRTQTALGGIGVSDPYIDELVLQLRHAQTG